MKMKKPKTIARVVAREAPPEVNTVGKWLAWRRAEDERMQAELAAQLEAWTELQKGAKVH